MPTRHPSASGLTPLLDGSTGELFPELAHHDLQQRIKLEVAAFLVAGRQECAEERLGLLNGYQARTLPPPG